MKPGYEIIGEASRIEVDEVTGQLFIVFEIKNEKQKQFIKNNWTSNDIELQIVNKTLIKEE